MRYLLGANTLNDMLIKGSAAGRWLATVNPAECSLSVVTVAIARSTVRSSGLSEMRRQRATSTLEQSLQRIINQAGDPLAVDHTMAQGVEPAAAAARLAVQRKGRQLPVGQDTRMILATASSYGLTLVEPRELYHAALAALGITVLSLQRRQGGRPDGRAAEATHTHRD